MLSLFLDSMHTTMMIDIKLTILKDCEREILNATRLHLYHGAKGRSV